MRRPADRPLWRILGYLGVKPRPVVAALGLGVGGSLSALGLAALSAWLITRAWQMPPILYLSVAITAVRALGISRGVFRYLERLATHDLALRAMSSARSRVFVALAAGRPSYSVQLGRGDLLSRTGADLDDLGNALIRGVIPIGIAVITDIAAVAIMAVVSVPAAVVLGVALFVSGVAAPVLAARGSADVVESGARARTELADSVTLALWHADELTVARSRARVLAEVADAERSVRAAADKGLRLQSLGSAAMPLAVGISLLAACVIGIGLAGDPTLTPMTLGVLILLPLSAFESTAPLTEAGLQLERSRQAATRILSLIDDAGSAELDNAGIDAFASADDIGVDVRPTRLTCRDLRWGWPTSPVGEALNVVIEPGERLAVVGPSGVGKTALLMTLAGLLTPRGGSIDAGGRDLSASTCYFADDAHIFSTSVAENLRVARGDASDEEIVVALTAVGLGAWIDGLPDGVDTTLSGGEAALSGGQRRRLLLARALLHRAPVVLLDEPTEHLDPVDADAVLRDIFSRDGSLFGAGRSVIVATHHLPRGHGADRVIDLAEYGLALGVE
ncbi:ABC transporter permease/ATP-binding protein CydC [Gordonia effusa NBRC 100432]|uniref:ABC transporter permease/ATP-binding protein CydC n=1 Tax=Gordonia effusa NBRC 100432 TaxID=1077974 RepID=H0R4E2_9ACTN|nr:thiol reductant ABC exporter subunit CydC [Gordonia effusa]GAB19943.1 ABC transporter permease/ATP-binding protein CydC [Gordonia effusa NBRC 100432]